MTPRAVATGFGLGRLPWGPGTWASAATIALAWGLHWAGGFWLLAAATVLVTAAGFWAAGRLVTGDEDPSEIVIDEIAGMMIALWPLSLGLTVAGAADHVWPWPGWVGGFLVFRLLDILKPPPVSWAERPGGALGLMLDDIVAGALTAGLMTLAAGAAHGWF